MLNVYNIGLASINASMRGGFMRRRDLLSMILCFGTAHYLKAATIALSPMTPQGKLMRVYVNNPTRIIQHCELWCWAASIAMIFQSHGHQLDQDVIVRRSINSNMAICTTGTTTTMGNNLSQAWVDSQGIHFNSQVVAAYDIFNGILAINNSVLVNELANDRPLLYANKSHAMVIVSVDYIATPMGPDVKAVGVLDPWPASPAFHYLSPKEIYPAHMGGDMTFLAAVHTT
ncbi:hypothetical protein [Buttiauxella sp.]|uniref:hypothetical protein n=1 Tax=Buttiauxella sp. TaxID=1972222 RepID=UPI003C77CC95